MCASWIWSSLHSVLQSTISVFLSDLPGAQCYLDGVSMVLERLETHEKHLEPMLQWMNTAALVSSLAKCHFRQAKLSPWVHSFSIMTETRSRLGLCSYRCSATKRNPKHSFLSPTLWFAELLSKYTLGMGPIKNVTLHFLKDGCSARSKLC